MEIVDKSFPAAAAVACVSRAPNVQFASTWKALHQTLGAGARSAVRPEFFAAFVASDLTGPASMEWYAAAAATDGHPSVAAPLEGLALPGGRYATFVHRGPYDGMGAAWGRFVAGLARSDRALDLSRPCLERYLNDPSTTAPDALETELCVPISAT
jgi:hypothetical protein